MGKCPVASRGRFCFPGSRAGRAGLGLGAADRGVWEGVSEQGYASPRLGWVWLWAPQGCAGGSHCHPSCWVLVGLVRGVLAVPKPPLLCSARPGLAPGLAPRALGRAGRARLGHDLLC